MEEPRASAEGCKWVMEPLVCMALVQTSPLGASKVSNHIKAAWWSMWRFQSACNEWGSVCVGKEATAIADVSAQILKEAPNEADVTQKL